MHIPFVPRVLVFSYFQTASCPNSAGWQGKRIYFLQYLQEQCTVGKDKREDSVFTEFPLQKRKYEKLMPS